ncbi:hypothetical protein NHX12_019851 [Muraenolepis orangiensis]|uniref:Uncharacterized protein n=1 Tax=Muraenolepis orangiensis TaxID=630683 RepID=A0A9Q0EUB0_9TELE|nr:hypothetical protein NHX12_019851 [Muraenolepis orangiensis]
MTPSGEQLTSTPWYTHTHTHLYTHVQTPLFTHTHTHTSTHTHTTTCLCVFVCVFYLQVSSSSAPESQEMNMVLSEAFGSMRVELNSQVLGRLDLQCMLGGEERALDLLERYSQLLLQAMEKKLESH